MKVPTSHRRLLTWIDEVKSVCNPDAVHWVDGSQKEYDSLMSELVSQRCRRGVVMARLWREYACSRLGCGASYW
jgi:GTP-dependent phosphoenolpyruvate carboxykinase